LVVSHGPGSDAGEKEEGCEKRTEAGTGIAEVRKENPKAADGKEDEKG
jgi:hypothetical protein